MNLTKALYQRSYFFFLGFFFLALLAFWGTYYSRIGAETDSYAHAHGLSMTLWLLLLIGQAWLIRSGFYKVHRVVGKASFLLVPFILLSTVLFVHHQIGGGRPLGLGHFYFLSLVLMGLVAFAVLYALAMWNRKEPTVHARYMIATLFTMVTPVTDRLIYGHFRPVVQWVPFLEFGPVVPVAGFVLADLLLIALVIWDWRGGQKLGAFAIALCILIFYHISVLTFYDMGWWQSFCYWFMGLSLT